MTTFQLVFRTNYNSRNINFKVGALYIGDNFNSDLGYHKKKNQFIKLIRVSDIHIGLKIKKY